MPDTDVKIKILVNDAQVKQGEASINRLKKASDDLGTSSTKTLTQQEKAARFLGKDVPDAANKAASGMAEVETASAGAAEGMAGASVAAVAVTGGIALLVVALVAAAAIMVSVAKEVTSLASQFAKYSIEVGNSAEQNGLATSTIVALNNEVKSGGRDFVDYTGAVASFRKEIGQAAAGSTAARAELKLLGIDGGTAINNIDGAFKQAIARIVSAPTEVEKVRLSFAAFGEDGYKLIPFFQQFNGNVDEAIKKAEQLGLTLSGKDVAASREFNRAFADVQSRIQGVEYELGREFLPTVKDVLDKVNNFLEENRTSIHNWSRVVVAAVEAALDMFKDLAKSIVDHPVLLRVAFGIVPEALNNAVNNSPHLPKPLTDRGSQLEGNPSPATNVPDPAALTAQIEETKRLAEKAAKEAAELAQRDLNGRISALQIFASRVEQTAAAAFSKIDKDFKSTGDIQKFNADTAAALDLYSKKITETEQKLKALQSQKDSQQNLTLGEISAEQQRQLQQEETLQNKITQLKQKAADINKAYTLKSADEAMKAAISFSEQQANAEVANEQYALDQGKVTERQYLDFVGQVALQVLARRKKALEDYVDAAKLTGNDLKKIADEELKVDNEITKQKLQNQRSLTTEQRHRLDVLNEIKRIQDQSPAQQATDAANEEKLSLTREIADLNAAITNSVSGVNDDLIVQVEHLKDVLAYRQQELDAVIEINRAQEQLSHSMEISENKIKAAVLDHLAQQKTLNEAIAAGINETYDAVAAKLDDQIDKMFAWAGAFKSLFTEPLKALARNGLTQLTTGLLDSIAPGLGDLFKDATTNPVAKPIVEQLKTTNKLLAQLVGASGQIPSLGGLNLGTLFGGSAGGGIFNLGGSGGGSTSLHEAGQVLGSGGSAQGGLGGIFGRITGPGGIFGSQGFGNNVGTFSGIGAIGGVLGGAIGGRVGGIISSTATGLSIGAQIGSIIPGIGTAIGAAIGAVGGFLFGLFSGDPNKKKDKNENIPALQKGFSDAMSQLNSILNDIRHLNIDPDQAIKEAGDIRAQIAGGFGIQFLSKKYKKQAQQMIGSELVQADQIIDQIKASAEIARGAADRSKRILPEFAGGTYFADFFRPNGLVPGAFDGADNILAMISRGEMVLNPAQQNRVRALAGGDVFAGAGIPNYPKGSASPKLAAGGIASAGLALATATPTVVQPNFTIVLNGVTFTKEASAWVESDDGTRSLGKFITLKTNASVK